MVISRLILLEIRNVLKRAVQKIKAYILCSVTFFLSRAVYEIMSKNMVEPMGTQMTSQYDAYELHAG
jgi:hypothetical protein